VDKGITGHGQSSSKTPWLSYFVVSRNQPKNGYLLKVREVWQNDFLVERVMASLHSQVVSQAIAAPFQNLVKTVTLKS
jgi:hypothetical protein